MAAAATVRTGRPEALLQDLVRGVELAAEVGGQQQRAEISSRPRRSRAAELQEASSRPRYAIPGHADEGERARLGGDDAGGDRPPGDGASGQKVVLDGALPAAEPRCRRR